MRSGNSLTAAQEILLAAADLSGRGKTAFSEWDLTVATWTRNKNRFGCRGYEDDYPDHKRVMMEIMGKSKKDNPLRRGWIEKSRPNYYRLTALGQAEAQRLAPAASSSTDSIKSAQPIYDAVQPYLDHKAFRDHKNNVDEPRMWLSAASFLGITKNERAHLEDRLRQLADATKVAINWMQANNRDYIQRGVTGGGTTFYLEDLKRLQRFSEILQDRFKIQLDAIRGTKAVS